MLIIGSNITRMESQIKIIVAKKNQYLKHKHPSGNLKFLFETYRGLK